MTAKLNPVETVRRAIEAVSELKTWYELRFQTEAPDYIGVYVDSSDEIGTELIRYDGEYIDLIYYFGVTGTFYEMHEKWLEILDRKFDGHWGFETHFAVSVYDVRKPTLAEGKKIQAMLEELKPCLTS